MTKYYEDYQYITTVYMDNRCELTEQIRVDLQNDNNIYGIVIGHWTTDEEQENEDVSVIQFRELTKQENITDSLLNDIDFKKEFLGILLWEEKHTCEFVLNIDNNNERIGAWYVIG